MIRYVARCAAISTFGTIAVLCYTQLNTKEMDLVSHTIVLSDESYQTLRVAAEARGVSISELVQAWATTLTAPIGPDAVERDPLAPFLGTFEATVPDLMRRHDDYLGDEALDRHAAS